MITKMFVGVGDLFSLNYSRIMANALKKSELGYLGEDFQFKLVHEFAGNPAFFEELNGIIDQNMFTDPMLKIYVGVMKDYFSKYGTVPSYDTMRTILCEKAHNDLEQDTYCAISDKILATSTEGVEYVRDLATRFFKQQNLVKMANKILKIASDGDADKYDSCFEVVTNAILQGNHNDTGTSVFDDLEGVLSDDYRVTIPTGITKIDAALEGGLAKGELGVIIASSGFGKTSMTTGMANHAATYRCQANNNQGFKVLQIVFEDRVKQIQRKHLGKITGIEARNLGKPEYIDIVKQRLEEYQDREMLQNNLRIVKFSSGDKSAWDIEVYIKKLINTGFKPDLVIIDYFECLKHKNEANVSNEFEKEGITMRKFEAMVGELDLAMWIPLQGTKDSVGKEIVSMDNAGGSFKKVQIAHVVISIARSLEDQSENKATLSILKNRSGCSGAVFQGAEFNNGTCTINTDNVDEFASRCDFNENRQEEMQDIQKKIMMGLAARGNK